MSTRRWLTSMRISRDRKEKYETGKAEDEGTGETSVNEFQPGVSLGRQRTDVMDRLLQNAAGRSASSPFPSSMTTETTVSKGQEFFSPAQTQGVQGEH